jgi:hypothetical protein
MRARNGILTALALLLVSVCHGQSTRDTAVVVDLGKVIESAQNAMHKGEVEELRQYVAPEARIVKGKKIAHIRDVLTGTEGRAMFGDDSTWSGVEVSAQTNDNNDAAYIVLKTLKITTGDYRYHTLVLYKKPQALWQIYQWHVGE